MQVRVVGNISIPINRFLGTRFGGTPPVGKVEATAVKEDGGTVSMEGTPIQFWEAFAGDTSLVSTTHAHMTLLISIVLLWRVSVAFSISLPNIDFCARTVRTSIVLTKQNFLHGLFGERGR